MPDLFLIDQIGFKNDVTAGLHRSLDLPNQRALQVVEVDDKIERGVVQLNVIEIGLAPIDAQLLRFGSLASCGQCYGRSIDSDDVETQLSKIERISSLAAGDVQDAPARQLPCVRFKHLAQEASRCVSAARLSVLFVPSGLIVLRQEWSLRRLSKPLARALARTLLLPRLFSKSGCTH